MLQLMVAVRAAALLLLAASAAAQLGSNIRIDWIEAGSGVSHPRLTGLESQPDTSTEAPGSSVGEIDYEKAWNRGGFADDTPADWFAASTVPRAKRPSSVTHPVGTVYTHSKTGARGVVIGWDARTVAPRQWVDATDNYGNYDWQDRLARLQIPHYSVLEEVVGANGKVQYLQRYVVSLCRKRLEQPSCLEFQRPSKQMSHPDLAKYFSHFDEKRGYIPNARLAALYPDG